MTGIDGLRARGSFGCVRRVKTERVADVAAECAISALRILALRIRLFAFGSHPAKPLRPHIARPGEWKPFRNPEDTVASNGRALRLAPAVRYDLRQFCRDPLFRDLHIKSPSTTYSAPG